MNVSKEKREKLVAKINAIKKFLQSAPQDENTNNLLTYIAEIEKDIKGKKYGLVFEEHKEVIDEVLENNVPVLDEDKSLFIDNGGQMNFLIEGDNLASLQLLEKTHKGKIDLIYIDPPYNTGNKTNDGGFKYNDEFVDKNDLYKSSKWLSFMKKRLVIAKSLMTKDSSIFISIDDHECSSLKILCDEIFGSNHFVTMIPRLTKAQRAGQEQYMDISHDYLICYSFADDFENIIDRDYSDNDIKVDHIGKYIPGDTKAILAAKSQGYSTGGDYDFEYNGKIYKPIDKNGERNRWLWTKERMQAAADLGILVETSSTLRMQLYLDKKFEERTNKMVDKDEKLIFHTSDFMTNKNYTNSKGVSDFDKISIEISRKFNNPKPVALIEKLIQFNKNTIVLDFFAGSGTTGHAVMELNKKDGGDRKFILCTNNENNICRDVTYERIKRVIAKENYPASLKYMKVNFVPISDKFYYEYADELLKHVKELVELENGINFNGNQELAIILTEAELDAFTNHLPAHCKTIYLGHDILPSGEQEAVFKQNKIKVNIIPDYYYRDLEG